MGINWEALVLSQTLLIQQLDHSEIISGMVTELNTSSPMIVTTSACVVGMNIAKNKKDIIIMYDSSLCTCR